ncbi:MAG TPA: MFS transporter, partial [Dehalococcoidia bacterium]|nr:MFS transporter [Dehalococcoidia bacterium]
MREALGGELKSLQQRDRAVLSNRRFLVLWLAQLFSQVAQNAILFTLLVIVLTRTRSTTDTSILVLSYVVPALLFGMVAGVLVDRWRKRDILIATNALRAFAAVAFLLSKDHVELIIAVNIAFSALGQFFATAEVATVPSLVPKNQLIAANSLVSLAWTGAQFTGMVFFAPIFLKTFGADFLFVATALFFVAAAVLVRWLPKTVGARDVGEAQGERFFQTAPRELGQALRLLRSDPASCLAMAQLTLSSSLVLLFAVLVPRFMQEVLDVRPDDAVYIFAPTGVGAILGLRLLPWLAGRIGKDRVVAFGLVGLAVCLIAMGLVQNIADALQRTEALNPFGPERLGGLSLLVALTMFFAGPLGLAYAMVNAPAQTVLHERAPPEMRGRVFGAQMALASVAAIIPLLVVGAVADIYGVSFVLFDI